MNERVEVFAARENTRPELISQGEVATNRMEFNLYKIEAGSGINPGGEQTLIYVITLEWKKGDIALGEFCRQINEVIKRMSGVQEVTISDIIFSLRSRR